MSLTELFTIENLLQHVLDESDDPTRAEDRKHLAELLEGVPNILAKLRPLMVCSPNDYRKLERLDVVTEGYVAKVLNENGLCCATGCPSCCVDDFTHVESCTTGYFHH